MRNRTPPMTTSSSNTVVAKLAGTISTTGLRPSTTTRRSSPTTTLSLRCKISPLVIFHHSLHQVHSSRIHHYHLILFSNDLCHHLVFLKKDYLVSSISASESWSTYKTPENMPNGSPKVQEQRCKKQIHTYTIWHKLSHSNSIWTRKKRYSYRLNLDNGFWIRYYLH